MTEPKWLTVARKKLGTREAPGRANNPTILGWAKRLGLKILGITYNADSVPWCGLFVASVLDEAGVDLLSEGRNRMKIGVRASAWGTWGARLRPERLAPGAILVFTRQGGGHVGFYVGEDDTAYHVLGGNQSDNVTITRIAKTRLTGARWPVGYPVNGSRVYLSRNGSLSRNEA